MPDISPLMPMHQDPLLVYTVLATLVNMLTQWGRETPCGIGAVTYNIGSGNGLSPAWRQAITWVHNAWLSPGAFTNKFQWILNQNTKLFGPENVFENIACYIGTILFKHQFVNKLFSKCVSPSAIDMQWSHMATGGTMVVIGLFSVIATITRNWHF